MLTNLLALAVVIAWGAALGQKKPDLFTGCVLCFGSITLALLELLG